MRLYLYVATNATALAGQSFVIVYINLHTIYYITFYTNVACVGVFVCGSLFNTINCCANYSARGINIAHKWASLLNLISFDSICTLFYIDFWIRILKLSQ